MINRDKKGLDEIFGTDGAKLMQSLLHSLVSMPNLGENEEDRIVRRLVNEDFLKFLDQATGRADICTGFGQNKTKNTTICDTPNSLETLRASIAAMNILAASGAFHAYEVSAATSKVGSWLGREVTLTQQVMDNKP